MGNNYCYDNVADVQAENKCGWNALDPNSVHPLFKDTAQVADQVSKTYQVTDELIVVRNSEGVQVSTSDTQVGVNIQVAIQALIAIVINISIASAETSKEIYQELLQYTKNAQVNRGRTIIEDSCKVEVRTRNTDVAVTVQLFLQILVALLISLNIL